VTVASDASFRFDGTNPHAQRAAAQKAADMVTRITTETRQAIRSLIVRSIKDGIPVYDAARAIRSMVGMNGPQAQAAMNYRAELIDSGLTIDRVNDLVDRYAEKKIRARPRLAHEDRPAAAATAGSPVGIAPEVPGEARPGRRGLSTGHP
jgi:hypothetical protein